MIQQKEKKEKRKKDIWLIKNNLEIREWSRKRKQNKMKKRKMKKKEKENHKRIKKGRSWFIWKKKEIRKKLI